MKFDIKDIQLLDTIAQTGTLTKASEVLHRTPSAITQSVKKLEEQLGFQLFDRSGYRLMLTQEGRLFLERGRLMLKQMERLEYDLKLIRQGWESEFSIAYDDLLSIEGIYALIKEFQTIAPNVSIRISREVLNGCWDALFLNRATLAIGASNEPPIELPCAQKTLCSIHFVFAVAPHHPLAKCSEPISREDISNYNSIVVSDTSQHLAIRSSGIFPMQPIIVVPSMAAKISAQVYGLGVGYLPLHRIEHLLHTGELVELKVSEHLKSKAILKTVWRTDSNSEILKWFLDKLNNESILSRFLGK